MTGDLLKLLAQDDEDLEVMASLLQDSIVPVSEISFSAQEKTLTFLLQRFCWEKGEDAACRINCTLVISGVEAVQHAGFDLHDPSFMLELLTIKADEKGVRLLFAGEAAMRVLSEKWEIRVKDFGEYWQTKQIPLHFINETLD